MLDQWDQKGRCPWQYSDNTFILDYRDPTHHQYNQQHNRNEDFKNSHWVFSFLLTSGLSLI
jgi:hypothetical protein